MCAITPIRLTCAVCRQDDPGPGQPAAHLVQGADGRAGDQEGPRRLRPAALHPAGQLAHHREWTAGDQHRELTS